LTRSRSQSSASSTDSWPDDLDEQLRIIRDELPDFSSDELAELAADSAFAEQLARTLRVATRQSPVVLSDEMSDEFESMFSDAELLEIERPYFQAHRRIPARRTQPTKAQVLMLS